MTHYVANIKIERVGVKVQAPKETKPKAPNYTTGGGHSYATETITMTVSERVVEEMAHVVIKADTLEQLVKKVNAHVALLEE